jgi:SHS2 domain-containing protein
MANHSETFEHTADVGIAGWGDTLTELYQAMAEGLAEFLCPRNSVCGVQERTIRVSADDGEALMVDFLTALMNLMQADHFMVASVLVSQPGENALEATVSGERFDPQRHELSTEIKAVTYHQLKVARENGRWVARVILDI